MKLIFSKNSVDILFGKAVDLIAELTVNFDLAALF
jgi:hypothetical protein